MKKIGSILLAVSLVFSVAGCGKSDAGAGHEGGGDSMVIGGGNSASTQQGSGSANRTVVQDDHVIVPMPEISADSFGNGFYDVYQTDGDEEYFSSEKNTSELSASYFFGYGGGVPMRQITISNDPGWVIGMSVSHEEIICQLETEQDANGNITLVHRYNDYAVYDYVFSYDSAGRMVRRDYYEYSQGQNRDDVGVMWYDEYSYDGDGRLTCARETSTQTSGVNVSIDYIYDNTGKLVQQVKNIQYFGDATYTIQQTYNSATQDYEYDDSGKVGAVTLTVVMTQGARVTAAYLPVK